VQKSDGNQIPPGNNEENPMNSFAASSALNSAMTAEEELAAYFAGQRPHAACLVQKDGVIRVELAPDFHSAQGKLLAMMIAHGQGFDRAFVKPSRA
jgi:hypothetical protein